MNRDVLVGITAMGLFSMLGACGAAPDGSGDRVESTDEGYTALEGGGGGGSTSGGLSPGDLQKRVTVAWQYGVGGSARPTDQFPCTGTDTSAAIMSGLDNLAYAISQGRTNWNFCTAGFVSNITVDGLSAGKSHVSCNNIPGSVYSAIRGISAAMNSCWPGASGYYASQFWLPGSWAFTNTGDWNGSSTSFYKGSFDVDPEPVSLTGSLSGTATYASSYGVNDGTFFWAYQFPGTWGVSSLPAGAPCATYSATYGTTLYSVIQASGSYRRCY